VADQKIETPNEAEVEWIATHVKIATTLAAAYGHGEGTTLPDPSQLDEAYAAWLAGWLETPEAERDDPNAYINAIGLAFGQTLVDDLGLQWAVITDEYGTEMAVHGQPGDVIVYPPNLVGKRFESGETHFLAPLYDEIKAQVDHVRNL
jgi:hypothetical protein